MERLDRSPHEPRRDGPAAEEDPAQPRAGAAARLQHPGEHGGDERDHRDVALAEQPGDAVGVERGRLEHHGPARGGAAHQHHEPADVGERHRAQPALVGIAAEDAPRGAHVRGEVAERELDGARRPGRARRMDDEGGLRLVGPRDVEGSTTVLGQRGAEQHLGAAEQVLALALGEPEVDRHGGRPQQQAGVDGDDEGAPRRQRDPDAVTRLGAARYEPAGPARRGDQELVVGQPLLGGLERQRARAPRGCAGEPGFDLHRMEAKGLCR
jgi:hypothetical protein